MPAGGFARVNPTSAWAVISPLTAPRGGRTDRSDARSGSQYSEYKWRLAGLGGALSAEILGLDPYFPLKFMIYFLIVVTVGGSSSITGAFLASLLLGIGDVAGKYYVPTMGPFVIYTLMIVILIWRPNGLFGRPAAR